MTLRLAVDLPEALPPEEGSSQFRWGTVTDTVPLTVRLDGDSIPLAAEPEALIDPLTLVIGTRVWVQLFARRVLVLGAARGKKDRADVADPVRNSITVTAATGWTITSATMFAWGPMRSFRCIFTRTGAAIGPSGTDGNFTDNTVAAAGAIPAADSPYGNQESAGWINGVIFIGFRLASDGSITLINAAGNPSYTIASGQAITYEHTYVVNF